MQLVLWMCSVTESRHELDIPQNKRSNDKLSRLCRGGLQINVTDSVRMMLLTS